MRRETKANVIFLIAFLAISLPGAVMLVRKKMRPDATPAPLSQPDAVRRRLPYMAPQVTSDKVTRYVPPLTREWLSEVDRSRGGSGEVLLRDALPVISDDRSLQVLNAGHNQAGSIVTFIAWEALAAPEVWTGQGKGRLERIDAVDVPAAVRKELQDGGFVTPPRRVVWLRAAFEPRFRSGAFIQVHVRSVDAPGGTSNFPAKSVNLFTS